MMYKTVGLIGCGLIGSHVFAELRQGPEIVVQFVCDTDIERAHRLDASLAIGSTDDIADWPDLVVEAASPSVVSASGPKLLERSSLLAFSVTALADDCLVQQLRETSARTGHVMYLPHGAIAGLDGLQDARALLTEVLVTTTKPPRSLGRNDIRRQVVFDGLTRDICGQYPRNVNVHAATALAGLGMDKTRSRLVSDPEAMSTCHVIEARGQRFRLRVETESDAGDGVTSGHTPPSAAALVRRVCTGARGLVIV